MRLDRTLESGTAARTGVRGEGLLSVTSEPTAGTSDTKHMKRGGGERVVGGVCGLGPSVLAPVLMLTHCLMAAE